MRRLAATLVILFFPSGLFGQDKEGTITLLGSFLTPSGKYGEALGDNAGLTRRFGFNIGEEAGLASSGFGIGVEFRTPVLTKGLEWTVSLQGFTNGINTTEASRFFQDEVGDSVAISFETGSWFHIPLFTGLTFGIPITEGMGFHLTLQGGLNLTRQAPRTVSADGVVVEETSFHFMPDFGYLVGLGFTVFADYQLLVRYMDLGTPRYEGTRTLNEHFFPTIPKRENAISGDPRPVTMFVISLGYTL